jgi:hypothetical protein
MREPGENRTSTDSATHRGLFRHIRRPSMSRPAEVVRLFIRQLELGKIRNAVMMLPERLVRTVGAARLESIFFENAAELRTKGGILRVEIVDERADERTAEVDVAMSYQDGTSDNEHVVLVKEQREWKVDMTK